MAANDTTHPTDENSYEGPDIETPLGGSDDDADSGSGDGSHDSEGTKEPGGLGKDGTIPNDPDGPAAGHTGEASTFEPEEDEKSS